MAYTKIIPAVCIAMACVLFQQPALAASQVDDRQEIDRWERNPGEFEEYRAFLHRGDEQAQGPTAVQSLKIGPQRHDEMVKTSEQSAVHPEGACFNSPLKNAAIKTAKITGKVIETTAKIVVGTALVLGYMILLSQRPAPRSSH